MPLWTPRKRVTPGYFGSPPGMLCQMTSDRLIDPTKVHFPLPEYVKQMSRGERRDWMRVNGVVPVIQGGAYSMFEMMQPWGVSASGNTFTAVTTPAAKTALSPDNLFTLPANIFAFVGKRLWFHASGVMSTAASAQTFVFSLNWGGNGGTVLATTGAIVPWAVVSTNTMWYADFWIVCRANTIAAYAGGTTALTLSTHGQVQSPTFQQTVTQSTSSTQLQFAPPNSATPGTAYADVASLDQTIAKALTLSLTPSLTTASVAMVDGWVVAYN